MIKLKHLRHPVRTATVAKSMISARLHMRRFALHGKRTFANDSRYHLQSVTDGFAPQANKAIDDTQLLKRIALAYARAVEQERSAPNAYHATGWWEGVRRCNLRPVLEALQSGDTCALSRMYRNFFRDPCSAGLVAVPYGMSHAYFGTRICDVHRHFYLSDTLYRVDHWQEQTGGRFPLSDLAGPAVGNPFGAVIDGILVRAGAEYQHYCAYRIEQLLHSSLATVVEVGGGFGGTAYYLLRNLIGLTYIDFDVPESTALASYFLMKSFPHLRFLLYGEGDLTANALERADVILMPLSSLMDMPLKSANLTFSSHAMSDLSRSAMAEYLEQISRATQEYFLYIGSARSHTILSELLQHVCESFQLMEMRCCDWNKHRMSHPEEIECSYRISYDRA
jgi:hypothetical protein